MKVPLSEQIAALEEIDESGYVDFDRGVQAAIATLRWVEKHLAELRVLGEFPGSTVEVREVGE
jgi:hypothetical protein